MGLFGKALGLLGAGADIIGGNQQKQRQKGLIGQAYRQDAYQQQLRQANTRQSLNESLNARGVLSAGANPGPVGTALQQVAKSGGPKIAGSGVDPFLTAAGQGATGAVNTLSGGANQQMTDQFGLEDLSLARDKSNAEKANQQQYLSTISGAIGQGIDTAANIASGGMAGATASAINGMTPASAPGSTGQMLGAYGIPSNPTFFSGGPTQSSQGTIVGDGSNPNYGFHG